jgi:hypothetical protein
LICRWWRPRGRRWWNPRSRRNGATSRRCSRPCKPLDRAERLRQRADLLT